MLRPHQAPRGGPAGTPRQRPTAVRGPAGEADVSTFGGQRMRKHGASPRTRGPGLPPGTRLQLEQSTSRGLHPGRPGRPLLRGVPFQKGRGDLRPAPERPFLPRPNPSRASGGPRVSPCVCTPTRAGSVSGHRPGAETSRFLRRGEKRGAPWGELGCRNTHSDSRPRSPGTPTHADTRRAPGEARGLPSGTRTLRPERHEAPRLLPPDKQDGGFPRSRDQSPGQVGSRPGARGKDAPGRKAARDASTRLTSHSFMA